MQNIKFIVIFFTALSPDILSQSKDSLRPHRVNITTSAFEYFPTLKLNTCNFNIGTETCFKRSNSIYFNCGYVRSFGPPSTLLGISSSSTQGIKLQAEGRHYFGRRKMVEPLILLFWFHIFQYHNQPFSNTGYYSAVHTSFQRTATNREETVPGYTNNFSFQNNADTRINTYTVNRSIYSANIKFGHQCIKKCGLTVDYSVGFGAALISSNSIHRLGPDTGWPQSEQDYPSRKLFDSGIGFLPGILYQFRLGWAL